MAERSCPCSTRKERMGSFIFITFLLFAVMTFILQAIGLTEIDFLARLVISVVVSGLIVIAGGKQND
jgi:hypothetical protein